MVGFCLGVYVEVRFDFVGHLGYHILGAFMRLD